MADAVKSSISTFQQPSFAPPAPSATFNFGQPQPLDISPTYNLPTPPSFAPAPYSSTYDFGQQQAYQPEPLDISPGYSYYPTFSEAEYTQPYGQAPQAAPVLDFSPAPYSSTYDFGQEQVYRPEPLNISPVLNFYPEQPDGAEFVQGYEPAGSGQFGFGGILGLAGDAAGMIGQAGNAYRNSGFVENFNAQTAWNGLTDFNQAVEDRGRRYLNEENPSFYDQFAGGGLGRIEIATGNDSLENLPGILPQVVDATLSPFSLLTAGQGANIGAGLRAALPGVTGRAAANLVEPVAGSGFASGLAGEAAINFGGLAGAELANNFLPEDMNPYLRSGLVTGASIIGGGAGVAAGRGVGLEPYKPPTAEMVFGTGRVGKPRTVIPDSREVVPRDFTVTERDWLGTPEYEVRAADGSLVANISQMSNGQWKARNIAEGSAPLPRGWNLGTLDEAIAAVKEAAPEIRGSAVSPMANERLWFHSTNDNTFDLPDPDAAVGSANGITQGPGVYMAADPARSAGRYGNRTIVSEFDGNVLDLTAPADEAIWRQVQARIEAKIRAAGVEPARGDPLSPEYRAKVRSFSDMGTADNGYGYRDALADWTYDAGLGMGGAAVAAREAMVRSGRFAGVADGTARLELAIVNDALADSGVDALFHHSPRADGDVLIVLNGAAARTLGETRNAADIVSSGKSWPEIVGETRRAAKAQVKLQKIDRPGWDEEVWRVRSSDGARVLGEIWKAQDGTYRVMQDGVETSAHATLDEARDVFRFLGSARPSWASVDEGKAMRPEVRSYGRAKTPRENLTTDLEPSRGGTESYGAGIPFFRRTQDPAQKLTEAMEAFTPGEAPATGLLRQYDGAVKVAGLEMLEDWENGVKTLQDLGLAKRSAGQVTVKRTDDMEALFKALHGEGEVPARLQDVYDDIKRLVDIEAKATEEFDPNFIMRDDYFYRGWRAPKETNAGAGGFGAKPGYAKPRTEATFSELLESGWEPVSWNPYDMLALRRMAGVTFREQKAMLTRMLDLGVAMKVDGPVPDGYRIPRIGPAFEGKPFAYTASAKAGDAATRLADEGSAARLGFTDKHAVPDGVANTLEELFGRRGADWKVGKVNVSETWRKSTGGLKRLKLIGSLFQQVDFTTRQGFATFGGVIDDVLHGKPLSAIKKTAMVPADIGKLAWANTRAGRRANLRRQILSDKPIIADRPGLTLKAIAQQGWSTQDITILNRNTVREMTENALKEPPEGWKGAMTLPARKAQQIDRAMQNGLFDGVYPQAQITALKNFVVPRLVRQHPDWSDARIAASAATEINKMFSTLGSWQTVFAGSPQGFKDFMRGILFSTNETESLLRQAFSTVSGPNKQMWITYYAGGALFLGLVANAVHYAATGEPLPLDRYQPIEKDEKSPYGYRYNSQFLSPEMPLIEGRGGFPVDLDLMGQMDTIFRMLDPKAFMDARFSVPVRAGLNQYTGEDFFGRKLDTPKERIGQLASDLGLPIGAGQALGAMGLGMEGEQRLGTEAQALQAGGLNLRARSNADLRDAAAQEKYGRPWDKLERFEQVDLIDADPALKEELNRRRDDALRNDQEWAQNSANIEKYTEFQKTDDAALASGKITPTEWRENYRKRQLQLSAVRDATFEGTSQQKTLLDKYYAMIEASETGNGLDVAWDKVDAWVAGLSPEDQAYIDRNTGIGGATETVKAYRADLKKIEASGYFDVRETVFDYYKKSMDDEKFSGTEDEYWDYLMEAYVGYALKRTNDREEARLMAEAAVRSAQAKFNSGLGQYRDDWKDENPEIVPTLRKWGYDKPNLSELAE